MVWQGRRSRFQEGHSASGNLALAVKLASCSCRVTVSSHEFRATHVAILGTVSWPSLALSERSRQPFVTSSGTQVP